MRDTMEGEEVVRQDMPGRERCDLQDPHHPSSHGLPGDAVTHQAEHC